MVLLIKLKAINPSKSKGCPYEMDSLYLNIRKEHEVRKTLFKLRIEKGLLSMNIFKEMGLSIYSYKSYAEFLKNKKGKVFGFGVMLAAIYFLITVGVPVVRFFGGESISSKIENTVPDFELSDGELWVDDVFVYDYRGTYVEIDTDARSVLRSAYDMQDFLDNYTQVIMMDSEKIIVKDKGQVQQYYFSELNFEFSRSDLLLFVPYVYIFLAVFMVIAFLWMEIWFFAGVLVVALISMIVASCMKVKISFGKLYLLSVYSRTLPLIIKAAVSFLPFGIPFFYIINIGLSVLIVGLALQKIKQQPQAPAGPPYGGGTGNYPGNDFSWM